MGGGYRVWQGHSRITSTNKSFGMCHVRDTINWHSGKYGFPVKKRIGRCRGEERTRHCYFLACQIRDGTSFCNSERSWTQTFVSRTITTFSLSVAMGQKKRGVFTRLFSAPPMGETPAVVRTYTRRTTIDQTDRLVSLVRYHTTNEHYMLRQCPSRSEYHRK